MSDTADYSDLVLRARAIAQAYRNSLVDELADAVEDLTARVDDMMKAADILGEINEAERDQLSSIVRDLAKSFDEEACSFCRLWTGQGEHDDDCPVLRARQLFPELS